MCVCVCVCVCVFVCFSNLTVNIHRQTNIQSYGFDAEADLPNENDETGGVIVPETT